MELTSQIKKLKVEVQKKNDKKQKTDSKPSTTLEPISVEDNTVGTKSVPNASTRSLAETNKPNKDISKYLPKNEETPKVEKDEEVEN